MKKTCKFLHIVPAKTGETIEFMHAMEKMPDAEDHKFLVLVPRITVIKKVPELLAFPCLECAGIPKGRFKKLKKIHWLSRKMKQAEHIVIHGLITGGDLIVNTLFLHPNLCEKVIWIENCNDVSNWEIPKKKLKRKIVNHIQRVVREKIPTVGIPFGSEERDILDRWSDKKVFTLPYPLPQKWIQAIGEIAKERGKREYAPLQKWITENSTQKARFRSWLSVQEEKTAADLDLELPNIQLCLSSQRFNRHNLAIQALNTYKKMPQNVFFPADFYIKKWSVVKGGKLYRKRTLQSAYGIWKEKFQLRNGAVAPEEYFDYLRTLDVAVLGGKDCVSATYLLLLLGAGVKLFLHAESYVYRYLQLCGMAVHSFTDCAELSFQEFVESDGPDALPESLKWYFDRDEVMVAWEKMYRTLEEKTR